MSKSLTALLMIVGLVACPFRCTAQSTRTQPAKEVADSGCRCCAHRSKPTEAPAAPKSDDDCCNCICNGAVLTDRESDVAVERSLVAAAVDISAMGVAEFARVTTCRRWDDDSGRGMPGRARRLAIHSLQI